MAKTIEHAAELKAIEVIRRLQKAVGAAFEKTQEEINSLTAQSVNHNALIGNLIEEQKEQAKKIERLEAERAPYPRDSFDS